jgi:hypothetical protein
VYQGTHVVKLFFLRHCDNISRSAYYWQVISVSVIFVEKAVFI